MLEEGRLPTRIRLAGLWTSVMFCYVYNDYFSLMRPGAIGLLMQGKGPLGPITRVFLLGAATSVAIPSLMIAGSLALPARVSRPLNVIVGALYTLLIGLIALAPGNWAFYLFFSVIEVALTALIVWTAWTWPKAGSA